MTEQAPTRFERPAMITLLALANLLASVLFLAAPFLLAGAVRQHLVVGPLLALAFLPVGLAAFVCGWGLWNLRPVGRHLQIGLACLGLLAVPLGTIVALLTLAYLFKPRTRLLFSGKGPHDLTDEELSLLGAPDSSGLLLALLGSSLLFLGCGLLAAVALPNLLYGIERGKLKRTMADIRAIGEGFEGFAGDHGSYPPVNNVDEVAVMLEPGYVSPLPRRDGWNHLFEIRGDHAGYMIRSAGSDGRFEQDPPGGPTRGSSADIIFSNGTFVQYPDSHP